MQSENYYPLPLNNEAQQCEVGREVYVDQRLLRAGSGVARLCEVLEVRDDEDGRRVTFVEVAQN